MVRFKCIIVDDEPIAIRVIRSHLSNFDEFEVVGECSNAIEAMKVLRTEKVDLLFLDIEMPVLTGLEMLRALPVAPEVIFTTAHRNYAVDAFDVKALDYLLKPISLDRFAQSINRFLDLKRASDSPPALLEDSGWLMLKVDKKNLRINLNEIDYIESLADYVIVHTAGKKLITKERISQLEEKLPDSDFLRVHRGYIVNRQKVTAWYGNTLELGAIKVPVGRLYKEAVFSKFNGE